LNKIQTFLVKSRKTTSLLSDFSNCWRLLGGGKDTVLLQVGSTDFTTNFFPAVKTL